jgi:hypothetical protein
MNIEKEKNALKYGYEGIISDPESFVLLTEEQKSDWTQKKKESE